MSRKEKTRRVRRLVGAGIAGTLLCALVASVVLLRVRFHGEALAGTVQTFLNDTVRGEVEIGSIEWPVSRLHTLATGGWLPITIRDIEVKDEFDDVVLHTGEITAELDTHAALIDGEIILRDVAIPRGGYALVKQVTEPQPVHEYDLHTTSLMLALRLETEPSFGAGYSAEAGTVIDLRDYRVDNLTLELAYPGFHATAYGVDISEGREGFLRFDGRDPLARKLYYSLQPSVERARVVTPIPIDLEELQVQRLAQIPRRWPLESMPRDFEYAATATTSLGTELSVTGRMKDFWIDYFGGDHELTLRLEQAEGIARAYSGGVAGGKELDVEIQMSGPTIVPKVKLRIANLELDVPIQEDRPPLELSVPRTAAVFDLATEAGKLEKTVARVSGGELEVAARFDLNPNSADIRLEIPKPIDLTPYLPPRLARLAGTRLSGRLHAFGNKRGQKIDDLDLSLGEARITGSLSRTDDGLIEAHQIDVALGRTRVKRIRGIIDVEHESLDIDFGLVSSDLARWLRALGAPRLATGLSGSGTVKGSFESPRARGRLVFQGVPVVSRLDADLAYRDLTLEVREAQSSAFNGWLRGSGKLDLGGKGPRLRDVEAQAVNLDLERLPGIGPILKGHADVKLEARGPVKRPEASLVADLEDWSLAGDAYRDSTLTAQSRLDGSQSVELHLSRKRGGRLDVQAHVSPERDLGGAVSLRDLPLSSVLATAGQDPKMAGGKLDAELQLAGTVDEPSADGAISVMRAWFREAFLGGIDLDFEEQEGAKVLVSGSLFQGKVHVSGTLGTLPPFDSDLELSLRRVELDLFAPELSKRYAARSWVSGNVQFQGPLMADEGAAPMELTAQLSEAVLLLDSEDEAGRPAPIRLRNRSPISLAFDGTTLVLREPAVIAGPAGDFELTGKGSLAALDFRATGSIAVELLEPYVREYFDRASGSVEVHAKLSGSADNPRLSGDLQFEDVAVRPRGQEAIVGIPSGKVDFNNDQLAVTGLRVVVVDEFSEEGSDLMVAGGVRLDDFVPQLWALRIEGQLAGKMLLVAFPEVFSAAGGSADVSVALLGVGEAPGIDGTIEFRPESALQVTPRGARRQIALTKGAIRFTDSLIELEGVGGWVDDEGEIAGIDGEISLVDWKPESVDVTVTARDLPFRLPQELELSLNLNRVRLLGGFEEGLEVAGTVEIVDGRYFRKWSPFLDALRPQRIAEADPPVWETFPLIANAELSLNLVTRAFFVKNNMADIELAGAVQVTGTPNDPRFEGVVRVEQGSFKFQGIRAEFTRTRGQITFSRFREFPEDTPTLQIESESEYQDVGGKSHLVTLALQGPFSNLNWDLTTNTGLNKANTLVLITAGQTPEDAREHLGDEPTGRRPGEVAGSDRTTSSTGEGGLYAVDHLAKDLFGDFFSLLIEDPIRNFTQLDVARLELGTASVGFRGEKNLTKNLKLVGEVDRSLRGWSWDVRGEYRLLDNWSADGEVLKKNYDDDAEDDEGIIRLRTTWRKVLIP